VNDSNSRRVSVTSETLLSLGGSETLLSIGGRISGDGCFAAPLQIALVLVRTLAPATEKQLAKNDLRV
jgi:hypothetical protein